MANGNLRTANSGFKPQNNAKEPKNFLVKFQTMIILYTDFKTYPYTVIYKIPYKIIDQDFSPPRGSPLEEPICYSALEYSATYW